MRLRVPQRILISLLLSSGISFSQSNPPQPPSLGGRPYPRQDEQRARLEREMAKKANQERQADLKRDTEKLLKLATELKESVDKSSVDLLSLDVVRKADEIERLAHSVKGKMKGN